MIAMTAGYVDKILRIDAPHFCAGAVFRISGKAWKCFLAAPIIRYMVGWSSGQAVAYCEKKGWTYEVLALRHEPPNQT